MHSVYNRQRGFTLLECAVVIAIVGILVGFAVPKFLNSVERSKASEAFNYLSSVQAGQRRHHSHKGTFAAKRSDLDVDLPILQYFESDGFAESNPDALRETWSMTLTRKGAPAGFGRYTVVFTKDGFDAARSSVSDFPAINPMDVPGGK